MPKLNSVVENLDGVDESLRDYYAEQKDKEGKAWFVLQFDDDLKGHPTLGALQRALDAQKQSNVALRAKLAEVEKRAEGLPDDWDPEEWTRLHEFEKQVKEKGGLEDDPDKKKAREAEVASIKKMHEEQLARVNKKMTDGAAEKDVKIKELKDRITGMVVRDGLMRELVAAGVKKEVLPFVSAKLEKAVKVQDQDGDFVAMVETPDLGSMPLAEYITKWAQSDEAKFAIEPPVGGGAGGGKGKAGSSGLEGQNPWTKSFWSMPRQAEIVTKDPVRADRLAKLAGHKRGWEGALQMDARDTAIMAA